MENLTGRLMVAIAGMLAIVIFLVPNAVNTEKFWWPTQKKLNYGLDIQGGLHLVMGVDVGGVVTESGQRLATALKSEFEREAISVGDIKVTKPAEGEFEFVVASAADREKVKNHLSNRYATMLQSVSETETSLTYRYFDSYLSDFKTKVIHQAIETIRNRIDEFGVAEPSISQQGDDRILVQLPGMADAERAKALINTAAKLDFMMVDDTHNLDLGALITAAETAGNYKLGQGEFKYSKYLDRLNKDLAGKIPPNTMVAFEKADNAQSIEVGRTPYLLSTTTNLGGDALTDAFVSFGQYGEPQVSMRFNAAGAAQFKELTGKNIGKRMAIVLDKVVKTAPNIQTAIGNGEAQITLGGGRDRDTQLNEAKMISTSLRAGALPAALEQLEERRVGPSLGSDAVRSAQMATLVAILLIFVFMVFRYRQMGIVSDISLAVNILAVLAVLTSLGATLTLPGIAGIALTVGFAVDANVLINERMREELAKGSSFRLAIKEGYSRAMSAIIDSNATTALVACVLLYFGTGPVRGFAVTLLTGIVTTLFANVFISRVLVDLLTERFGVKKMSV